MYGKIENNKLLYAPNTLIIDGRRIINPPTALLEQEGYKLIINNPYPDDGKRYKQGFEETHTEIRIIWVDNEAEYWQSVDYGEAVDSLMRDKYAQHQVEAIINNYFIYLAEPSNLDYEIYRAEMQALQEYRQWCKDFAKEQKEKYN